MADVSCLQVATLNCMLIPTTKRVVRRARAIAEWLLRHCAFVDVLVLTEIMHPVATHELCQKLLARWKFQSRPLHGERHNLNGGVMLASRWPLTNVHSFKFRHASMAGGDKLAAKGVVAALVRNPSWAVPFVVCGTHLQSSHTKSGIREKQMQEVESFLHSYIPSRVGKVPRVIAGDFNTDLLQDDLLARSGLKRVATPALDGVTFDLENNAIAKRRAFKGDETSMLDAVAVDQHEMPFCFVAAARVLKPRGADGSPFTDHEGIVAAIAATAPRA